METRIRRRIASVHIFSYYNVSVWVPYSIRIASGIQRWYSVYLFKKVSQKRFKQYPGKFPVFSWQTIPEPIPDGFHLMHPILGVDTRTGNNGKDLPDILGNPGRSVKSRRDFPDTRKGKVMKYPRPGRDFRICKKKGDPWRDPLRKEKTMNNTFVSQCFMSMYFLWKPYGIFSGTVREIIYGIIWKKFLK